MWICQRCAARNWDEDDVCHKCKGQIGPEEASAVRQRRSPKRHDPEPVPDQPLVLPKTIELLKGSFFTDGGSVTLQVRDETGAEYCIGLRVSYGRRTGGWRLFFRDSRVVLASQQHVDILQLLRDASIAPSLAEGTQAQKDVTRNLTVIGDDLQALFGSMGKREDFLRTLRDQFVSRLEALNRSPSLGPFTL